MRGLFLEGEIMFIRSPFNYDMSEASKASGVDFTVVDADGVVHKARSRTQKEFKEEADINEIVRRFGLTGELPENVRVPVSGDFTGIDDYQSALNAVIAADNAFNELPAELRARFANSPQKLLEFVADDKNRSEAEKLGLLKAPPPRDVVTAVDELAAKVVASK